MTVTATLPCDLSLTVAGLSVWGTTVSPPSGGTLTVPVEHTYETVMAANAQPVVALVAQSTGAGGCSVVTPTSILHAPATSLAIYTQAE